MLIHVQNVYSDPIKQSLFNYVIHNYYARKKSQSVILESLEVSIV